MPKLEFLGLVEGLEARSPLERALALSDPTLGIRDISLATGKVEVRGALRSLNVRGQVVQITPKRALVLCEPSETASVRSVAEEQGLFAVDLTGALAGLELTGERLLRRLTDLDLQALPAVGSVAHVPAILVRDGDRFRIFFPQEYGHYLAEVVVDAAQGLVQ